MSCECLHSKIIHRTWKELNGEKIDRFLCTTCGTEFIPKIRPKQEELMSDHIVDVNKKVQMTTEQALQMIDVCGWNPDAMKDLKKHGYIKRTVIEEAEALYREYADKRIHSGRFEIVEVQHEAIRELKRQLEARGVDEK